MSFLKRNKIFAGVCAAAMLLSSTAVSAAPVPNTVDPWLALSAMSTGGSSAMAASSAAVQSSDRYERGFSAPPWPALAVIAATLALAIYLLIDEDDDELPVSPA
jgi:hypothetical protein